MLSGNSVEMEIGKAFRREIGRDVESEVGET